MKSTLTLYSSPSYPLAEPGFEVFNEQEVNFELGLSAPERTFVGESALNIPARHFERSEVETRAKRLT